MLGDLYILHHRCALGIIRIALTGDNGWKHLRRGVGFRQTLFSLAAQIVYFQTSAIFVGP